MDARLNTLRFNEAKPGKRAMMSFDSVSEYTAWKMDNIGRPYREVGTVTNPANGAYHVWIVRIRE